MPDENQGIQMTQKEYDKLQAEYEEMVNVKKKEVAEELKEARSYGDLSENAEYDAAKEKQAKLHEELTRLQNRLNNAIIVTSIDVSKVGLGMTVKVKSTDDGSEKSFAIVGTGVDPFSDPIRVSSSSPIGRGLSGKAVGDIVEIVTPKGKKFHYEIQDITQTEI
ncbi:MAG: transcription elongation factor GreA [Eubacteriales bacterium]|nr:transcription elongation factor GreA [Eubacteriales bacterium]